MITREEYENWEEEPFFCEDPHCTEPCDECLKKIDKEED